MRKTISLILVAAMLMCGIMIPTSTSAAAVLEDNVAANANYFGGTLIYVENSGSKGDTYEDPVTVKEGASGTITLDGVIEPGEWGDVAVHVDSAYAASNKNAVGKWLNDVKNDAMYSHPSAENTYFYGNATSVNDREFNYDLYFLWDEDFLYVAAHVNDPYNHQNVHQGADAWEGDALQFMVDPQGPNSAAVADGTTYAYRAEHGIRHEEINGQKVITYDNAPWAGAVIKQGTNEKTYCPVSNFIVAYASGVSEAWDAALRYNPELEEYNGTDESGNVVPMTRTKWNTAGINFGYQDDYWMNQDVSAYATVRPINHGNIKEPDYTTDYEVAIPWEMITLANDDGTFRETMTPASGTELGITVAVLNASKPGNGTYDSWLSWGSGICGSQSMYDYQTAGGSNLLTLTSTGYKDYTACEHTFA
ncbi:MAG: sugar-binding protein, partial [Clostridia bacterium]|nr:sugar-binding protein [Clostridia bacterium]